MIIGQDYANALTDVPTQMLIAPVLPTMVSDRAYAVGEQFIVNSVLYKITQTVSGADVPLVVGTNCAVSDSITQQIESMSIKSATFSGTTDSAGNVSGFNVPTTSRIILCAKSTTGDCFLVWVSGSSNQILKAFTTLNGNLAVITNKSVSGTYYYIDNDSF